MLYLQTVYFNKNYFYDIKNITFKKFNLKLNSYVSSLSAN